MHMQTQSSKGDINLGYISFISVLLHCSASIARSASKGQADASRKSRVSDVYSDGRYNWTRLHRMYKLPEVGGDFCR